MLLQSKRIQIDKLFPFQEFSTNWHIRQNTVYELHILLGFGNLILYLFF